jgi:hypothetical protein
VYIKILIFILTTLLQGCFLVPFKPENYKGPDTKPAWIDAYYAKPKSYDSWKIEVIRRESDYTLNRIYINSSAGETVIDYYQRKEASENLILVFPILGGKENLIESYFADSFARDGYDSAIIHRDKDFKDPRNVDRLEKILRKSVIRDRLALDFFEKQYNKKEFATFGISRGGINVAISAGIEPRLKYNVIAMGGTKLVKLFAYSSERRIREYRTTVQREKQISGEEFIERLEEQLKTDPKNLAHYMDPRKTLMILSLFDQTVPIKYGRELREQIGKPKTIYLLADHRVSILYTRFLPIFPFDYIETQALAFYDKSFHKCRPRLKQILFDIMQVPFIIVEKLTHIF